MLVGMFLLAILIEIVFPVVLAFWVIHKLKSRWIVVGVGALAFILSQLIHIPILLGLQPLLISSGFTSLPPVAALILTGLFYGLLAGLCEESMRWLSYKVLKEKGQQPNTSVVLGVGHGGIESVLLVGLSVAITFFTMLSVRNTGVALPGVTLEMVQQYFSMDWYVPLAGALERLTAISIHIGMSVVVWKSVRHRSWKWFLAAVLLHTFYDATAVMMSMQGINIWIIEGVFVIFAAISIFWTIRTLKTETPLELELPGAALEPDVTEQEASNL